MFGLGKIIESLATVTANTENHNGELREFKETFKNHIEKEEREAIATNKKIDALQSCLASKECPNYGDFKKIERRFHDQKKVSENRRTTDLEDRAREKAESIKEKTLELKERAKKDEDIAKEISSLKTSRKYQWLTSSGIYVVLAVILKKIFSGP